ncbi:MAG: DoxX family protein [Bacteroidetes bacterium]|nr:DoxX family protein [Bacteroidota bacterium]
MKKNWLWIPALVAAGILLQTLYFKFTAHPDSVLIFTTLGVEPYGRILTGVLELITAIVLMIPRLRVFAAVNGAMMMLGAIASHLVLLGIEVQDDGGLLFGLAVAVLTCCSIIAWVERERLLRFVRA